MKNNILFINACVRPESRTLRLAQQLLAQMPGEVQELDLYAEKIQPLNAETLQQRYDLIKEGRLGEDSFRYANGFAGADCIVIAAPYWDLLFPAVLKCYLEAVTVAGITFRYNEHGVPQGLCRAKKLIYVTTAGGPIIEGFSMGYDHIKVLAQMLFGIKDVRCLTAEGLDIIGADVEGILAEAAERIKDML